MSLWNFSFTQHHLFYYRTSVIFILCIPYCMDHLTRNLVIHCHGSCLTIPPSIFRLSTPLFKAPSFHLSLSLDFHIDSSFKQTMFFNFFALLIHCSFPLLFSSSGLWFSFSVTLLVFQWGKNSAFSSFSAFISTISVFLLKYHNFTFSLLFASVPQQTFNCFSPWKYCQVSSLCFLNSNWQFILTKKWVFYD